MDLYYDTKWKNEYDHLNSSSFISSKQLTFDYLDNGIVLPGKIQNGFELGGLINREGISISETTIPGYFGGTYDFDKHILKEINETVFLLPVAFHQWGHFLIDSISWLWALEQYRAEGYIKIAYCGSYFDDGISGNYLEFLSLLGINREHLIKIETPTQFKRVYYAERSFGNWTDSHKEYKYLIESVRDTALEKAKKLNLPKYKKLYLTRDMFSESMEIGEKTLQKTFELNDFKVLAPERLSLVEQIWYIYNANIIASLSGSISLNAMFASKNSKWVILNRTSQPNLAQFKINELFNVNCDNIDCYSIKSAQKQLIKKDTPVIIKDSVVFNNYLKLSGYKKYPYSSVLRIIYYAIYQTQLIKKWFQNTKFKSICSPKEAKSKLKMFKFGGYKYCHELRKPLEWYVLDSLGTKRMLICKYGIDYMSFNEKCEVTSWEQSSIKTWLNTSFYNSFFSEMEKEQIVSSNCLSKCSNEFLELDGNVDERIFLLSDMEVERYLVSGKQRKCKTIVFKNNGNSKFHEKKIRTPWWLRTSGYRSYNAKVVDINGNINHNGLNIYLNSTVAVRPVIWVDLKIKNGSEQYNV